MDEALLRAFDRDEIVDRTAYYAVEKLIFTFRSWWDARLRINHEDDIPKDLNN